MNTLREALATYLESSHIFKEEIPAVRQMLLTLDESFPHCFSRDCFPSHFTASSWVLNTAKTHCALLHHKKLDKWMQAGGHADGDIDLLHVSKKELREETGLEDVELMYSGIFDCDAHRIPQYKNLPSHTHLDVRFIFRSLTDSQLKNNQESKEVRWVPFEDVSSFTNESSVLRMLDKGFLLCKNSTDILPSTI